MLVRLITEQRVECGRLIHARSFERNSGWSCCLEMGRGLHFNHFDFHHRVLASRSCPMLAVKEGALFLFQVIGKDCLLEPVRIRLQ